MYESAGMVALLQNNKWSLYEYIHAKHNKKAELKPLDFASNVPHLDVYEDLNLVAATNGVYSLKGELLLEGFDAKIIRAGKMALIAYDKKSGMYPVTLLIWDGKAILNKFSCSGYAYSDQYLAISHCGFWSLYEVNGATIEEGAFFADIVEIYHDLLVTRGLCNQGLYLIPERKFIKEKQLRIVCCNGERNVALCAQMGNNNLSVYSSGEWRTIVATEGFGFVEGAHLFYIKRDGKYFLYKYDATRFMKRMYPDGVDFISYDKESNLVLIVNENEPEFFSINV